jgi:hypothetical protein
MTATVLAVSVAYALIGVLLLVIGLTARVSWWIKAAAIVLTSGFFIEAFYSTKGLLGWPGTGALPPQFQLLWARVVEPDRKTGDRGAIYLWVEEVDENNVPVGIPRSYRLPYSRPLADRSSNARDEIMRGRPQQGLAEDINGIESKHEATTDKVLTDGTRPDPGALTVDVDQLQLLQQAQRVQFRPMPGPTLPPKGP